MPCQPKEFVVSSVLLEHSDIDRIFLLGSYSKYTKNGSCKLTETLAAIHDDPKVQGFISDVIDLTVNPELAIIIVTTEAECGALVITDGNHRAIAHYLQNQTIDGVPAFVCANPCIGQWEFIPEGAK